MADETAETSVVAALILNIENFVRGFTEDAPNAVNEGMQRIKSKVNDGLNGIEGSMREAGRAGGKGFFDGLSLVAGAGAIAFLEQLKSQLERGMQFAHEMVVLKLETGESFSQLQRLEYAFASVGVSTDRARLMFAQLQYQIDNAAVMGKGRSILERMGLDPKQMQTQTFEQNLEQISDKIRQFNSISQTDIARKLFGRTGVELLPLLTQGSTGLKTTEAGAGSDADLARIDAVLTKLDELHNKSMQIAIEMRNAWLLMLEPIINGLLRIVDAVQNALKWFQTLSASTRADILFGGIVTALTLSADLLAVLRPLFSNLIGREVLTGLGEFVTHLNGLVIIGGILYAAWRSDFGGIREAFAPVISELITLIKQIPGIVEYAGHAFREDILPALRDLSDAFKPLMQDIADFILAILGTGDHLSNVHGTIDSFAKALGAIVEALAQVIKWLNNAVTALDSFSGANKNAGDAIDKNTRKIQLCKYWIMVFVDTLDTLVAEITRAVIYAIYGLVLAIQLLLDVLAKIPGLGDVFSPLADSAEHAANRIRATADGIQDSVNRMWAATNSIPEGNKYPGEAGGSWAAPAKKAKNPPAPPFGSQSLPAPEAAGGAAATQAARENIDRIKESLEKYDDAVKDADLHVRGLQSQIESLGKIDTADKLTKAERLYKEEVAAVNVLHHEREIQLRAEQRAAAELHSLDVSAERVARGNPKNKEDQTIARDYHSAWREAHSKVHELQVQTIDDQTKVNKLQQDSIRLAVDYYNSISADTSTTFDARTAALQTELTILQKHNENLVEQHKLMRDIVALDNERIAAEEKTGPQVTTQLAIDQVTRQADLLAAGIRGGTKESPGIAKPEEFGPHGTKTADDQVALQKTHLELQLAVLRAEAALEVFSRTLTTEFGGQLSDNAKAAFKSLVDAMRNGAAPEQLSALLNSFINAVPPAVRNTGEFSAALEKLLPTINTQTTATTAVDVAQQKLADDINKTSERVQSVREQFDSLAKETAGPLYDLFTGLAGNGANLVTSFIDLFKQTLAYKDIQIVMAAITKTLAQVFEALRPIIDLLLGVLIGVVDMFIFLINMMISFLNIFGLHIQHLKTVNDILKDLGNNAKPLLQITHDLPTFNEYNAGKWADLRAQQQANANDLNSLLHNGFNKTFGQLGQIIGTLLAIKVLLTLMSAGGLNGMGGGGIFGFLGKLLGFGGGGGAFLPASDVGIGGVASFGGAPLAGMADAVSSGDLASAVSDGVVQGMSQNAETNAMLAAQGNATQDAIAANTERTASALDGTTTTTGSVVDHLGNIVKYVRGFGDVMAIAGGYKAGGIGGGISAGIGAEQLAMLLGATGPVGILAGAVVGLGALLFGGGGLFGHKSNSRDNPDMFPNTNWGQDNANLRGSGLNGAPTFHSQVGGNYSAQTGMDMGYLQYIGTWIAQNQAKAKQVLGNLVNIFQGENVGNPIKGGKNGFLDLVNGVHLYFSDLYNDAMQAVRDITGGGGVGDPGSLAALFAGAGNLNLATLFGTGGAYAIPGGYGITGGVPTTLPNTGNNSLPGITQPPSNSQSIVINIEHVHGSTTSEIQRAFGPVIDDLAEMLSRRQQLYTRASENTVGRI